VCVCVYKYIYTKPLFLPYGQYTSDQTPFKSHVLRLQKFNIIRKTEGWHRLQVATSSVLYNVQDVTLIKIVFYFKVHQHITFATYTE